MGVGIHKDLSYSYREGIDKKLKSMAQPYKMTVFEYKLLESYVDGIESYVDVATILWGTGAPTRFFCFFKCGDPSKQNLQSKSDEN